MFRHGWFRVLRLRFQNVTLYLTAQVIRRFSSKDSGKPMRWDQMFMSCKSLCYHSFGPQESNKQVPCTSGPRFVLWVPYPHGPHGSTGISTGLRAQQTLCESACPTLH